MAWLAQGHEVVLVVGTALTDGLDVVDYLCLRQSSVLPAKLAEGMLGQEGGTDPLPVLAVALCRVRVALVLLVLPVRQPLVFLAVPSAGKPGTPRVGARLLWLERHGLSLFSELLRARL